MRTARGAGRGGARLAALDDAMQEVRDERPDEIGVVRLEALRVGMPESVIGMGEGVPLDEATVGHEALPERRLDRRCRDVVLPAAEDERRARERPRQLERGTRPMRRLGLVADRRVVEYDRA